MKASLLLSLGLLLVLLAASAPSIAQGNPEKEDSGEQIPSPSSTTQSASASTQSSGTTESASTSTQSSGTTQSASASTQSSGTTQSASASTQSSGTTQSASASTQSSGTTQSASASTQSSGTTESASASTQSSGTTQSASTSTQSSGTTQSASASTQSSGTTQSASASTQSSGTTQSASASTQSSGTTQSASASTQSSGTTQSASASTQSSGTTQSASASTQSSGTTQSASASTQSSGTTQSASASTQSSGTTQSPGISSQTTTPGPRDPCEIDPCKGTASCVNLFSERFCLCSEGYYYQTSSCVKGKTFPGELTVKVTESPDLEDKNSQTYQNFHNSVVNFLKNALNQPAYGYGQTIILKVSDFSSPSARSAMLRVAEKTVYVSVVNMFEENTLQNESTIAAAIEMAVKNDENVTSYTRQDLCDYYGCEKDKSNCQNEAVWCKCKPGWIRPNQLIPFCFPQECPESCKAEDRKQCLVKDNGVSECVCMPGYQKATDGKCEECPFGYSGMDCKDQFQLILTIVGTIAGAFILILLIALIVSASSKRRKKDVEEQNLIENDFHNVRLQQTGFSNFGADNSIFPKVRTGAPRQTQNPYDNQRSMPRPDY